MNQDKPKALVFFQYLPPWRIDVFNEMAKYYQLTIAFTDAEIDGFSYDRQLLLSQLNPETKTIFLSKGFRIGSRPIRFGVYDLIKRIKPNVIFSHEYSPTSILVATYKKIKLFKYQYVITTSDNVGIAESVSGLKAIFRNYILRSSDVIIVYSEAVKKFYQKGYPFLRVAICPNIQNPITLLKHRNYFDSLVKYYETKFELNGFKIILYTGRLSFDKGIDLLLDAFSNSFNDGYKLVLVGDGHEKENLMKQCKDLNLEDKVVFAGFYSGSELYAWYDLANFYILPSRYEPFGAVVNEALVYGCQVMASKFIGAVDFINDSNGVLFNPLIEKEFIGTLNDFYKKLDLIENKKTDLMIVSFDSCVSVFNEIYIS
jgi:glycosyltransferase involved in cell wall biosynthesis